MNTFIQSSSLMLALFYFQALAFTLEQGKIVLDLIMIIYSMYVFQIEDCNPLMCGS